MTALDVAAAVRELRQLVVGALVSNVYQALDGSIVLKLRRRGESFTLIGDALGRIGLTWVEYAKPSRPPSFCALLRKHIRGGRVVEVKQLGMDRVVAIDIVKEGSSRSLIFELVRGFNALLVEDGVIVGCLRPRRMKDRALLPRESYRPPPWRGLNPLLCSPEEFFNELRKHRGKLVPALVKAFNVSSEEAEEACLRAKVDREVEASGVSVEVAREIHRSLVELWRRVTEGELNPHVVLLKGEPATVLPIKLASIEGEEEGFPLFNEALDRYFTWLRGRLEEEERSARLREVEERLKDTLELQKAKLEELKRREAQLRAEAELIMSQLPTAQRAIEAAVKAVESGLRGREVLEAVRREAPEVEEVDLAAKTVRVKLDGREVVLSYLSTAAQNASRVYEEAKEAERKARRVEEAMKSTLEQALKAERKVKEEAPSFKRRAWYEEFRWFYTSNSLLVVGGRDSSQNEKLVRKYLSEGDVFLHADIYGAPVVVVKQGVKAAEEDLREAAQFAVAYSRAWREGRLQGDAYWVWPSQVSKTPPSGEYLPRGAFMVRGERNYLRGVPLELAVGIDGEGRVIGGPAVPVAKRAKRYVVLAPGHTSPSSLAKEVAAKLELPQSRVEEVSRFMPPGPSRIIKVVKEDTSEGAK
ncbi:MAG: ribosome rescue protein RqcH [Candidatus Nezhaarchaeota archaeon]|nr:ribosome rescue protein RqcH [Candidatus Nezhaarchaeota archaeon]